MQRRIHRLVLLVGVVLLVATGARESVAEGESFLEKDAKALAGAFDAEDQEELERLARREGTDPWQTVEQLGSIGRTDVAAAFAAAHGGQEEAALLAYAHALAVTPPDDRERALLDQAAEAMGDGDEEGALALTEGITSADSVTRILVASTRGHAHRGLGRNAESFEAFRRAASGARGLGWLTLAADRYRQAGRGALHARLFREAEAGYRNSLEVYTELGDRKKIAILTASVAIALERQARFPEAIAGYERAQRLFLEVGHEIGAIEVLYGIGEIHSKLGRGRRALPMFQEGLALAEARGDRGRIVRGLLNVSAALLGLNRDREALPYLERARDLAEAVFDRAQVAGALSNIGIVHLRLGDYPAALETYRRALALAEQAESGLDIALSLMNVGVVHRRLGDDERALENYMRALEIHEGMGRKAEMTTCLSNIGAVHLSLGHDDEAEVWLKRALDLSEELGDDPATASALRGLATTYRLAGKRDEALAATERAYELDRSTSSDIRVASALGSVAYEREKRGEYPEALAAANEAFTLLGDAPAPDTRLWMLWMKARIRLAQGCPEEAIGLVRQGVGLLAQLSEGLADEEGASTRETYSGLFATGMRAAYASGDVESLAAFFEHGRAGMLREGLGSRGALAAAVLSPDLREDLALARTMERQAAESLDDARGRGDLTELRAAKQVLIDAQDDTHDVVARVQREERRAAALVFPAPDDLETIQSHLQPHEALVYYGVTKRETLALIVRRDRTRMAALAPKQEIHQAIDALLLDEDPHVDLAGVAGVRRLVVDPLELDESVTRVLVSPTARLGYVPFALLLPDHEIAYVSSGTVHAMLRVEKPRGDTQVLALGDPAYGVVASAAADVHRGVLHGRLPRLPATRDEVEAVGTVRLLGEDATEAGFLTALASRPTWRAVHFACHGLVDAERPAMSCLALTPDEDNDGFLTALEVFRLEIPADLVVLSACETARGRVVRTEGIVGLTRAFMFAGSPRVICSLWKVDDEATRALMTKFYELWTPATGEGLGAAAALKAAQAHVRSHEKWAHPYYWAAWVLWGLPE